MKILLTNLPRESETKDYELPLPRSPELQRELEVMADDSQRRFCYGPEFIQREVKGTLFHPKLLVFKAIFAFLLLLKTWHRRQRLGIGAGRS